MVSVDTDVSHYGEHYSHRGIVLPRYKYSARRRLLVGSALTGSVMVVELVGGVVTGSLALISDAGHMLTHLSALLISLIALLLAARPPSKRYTYGYFRTETMGALINGLFVIGVSLYIMVEAVMRLMAPIAIAVGEMLLIGVIGLIANMATVLLLHEASREDLNVKGAFLHVLGDTFSSFGVIVAALIITITGWVTIDAAVSLLIALVILVWGLRLLHSSSAILLQSVPSHIDPDRLVNDLLFHLPQISDVHDLHLWTLTLGSYCLSAHLVINQDCQISETHQLLDKINRFLHDRYGIYHTTFQFECPQGGRLEYRSQQEEESVRQLSYQG